MKPDGIVVMIGVGTAKTDHNYIAIYSCFIFSVDIRVYVVIHIHICMYIRTYMYDVYTCVCCVCVCVCVQALNHVILQV